MIKMKTFIKCKNKNEALSHMGRLALIWVQYLLEVFSSCQKCKCSRRCRELLVSETKLLNIGLGQL